VIKLYGEPILRAKTRPVPRVTEQTRALVARLEQALEDNSGLGVAAPQIGELARVVVYDLGEGPVALINPKITAREGEAVMEEGCLSLPNLHGEVVRALRVTVKALDEQGRSFVRQAEGLEARVIQHECDHLEGKLFIDRVRRETLYWAVGEDENGEPYRQPTTLESALRVFESRVRAQA